MLKSPLLLLVYNRPDLTASTLSRVLAQRPHRLYVAGDGPRGEEDRAAVEATRRLVRELVPDNVELHTMWREDNLGCKRAVEGAITWFFEHEDQGIVIEDDCVPGDSFFPFMELMLERYRADERIMHVSGYAHHPEDGDGYYFDRVPAVWGWATWRRSWDRYQGDIPRMTEDQRSRLRGGFASNSEATYYTDKFDEVARGDLDSWAFAWVFSVITNHGLCVRPTRNLVENIGVGDERATHTRRRWMGIKSNVASEVRVSDPQEPDYFVPDHRREQRFFKRSMRRPLYGLRKFAKRIRQ